MLETLSQGVLLALWAVKHSIETSPIFLDEPMQIITLNKKRS